MLFVCVKLNRTEATGKDHLPISHVRCAPSVLVYSFVSLLGSLLIYTDIDFCISKMLEMFGHLLVSRVFSERIIQPPYPVRLARSLSRLYTYYVDRTTIWTKTRWSSFFALLLLYVVRVYLLQGELLSYLLV